MNTAIRLSMVLTCYAAGLIATQADLMIPSIGKIGEPKKLVEGFTFTEGPAADRHGNLYFTDVPENRIHRLDARGSLSTIWSDSQRCNGLMVAGSGRIIACQGGAGRVISFDPQTKDVEVLADQFEGKRFNAPNDLVLDRLGGIYFTDPQFGQQPNTQGTYAVYYIDRANKVSRVLADLPKPNGIMLSPDQRTLYVLPSSADHLMAWLLIKAGTLGKGGNWCELAKGRDGKTGGGDGMTVDTKGNLYLTLPSQKAVHIVSSKGKTLGMIYFPEGPANCTFGGGDMRTLFVTAQKSVYAVRLEVRGYRFTAPGR